METQAVTNWNAELTGRLEHLYRDGLSFRLIAADIGVSRNAAIGKARRMQLPKREVIAQCKQRDSSARPPPRRRRKAPAPMPKPPEPPLDPLHDYRCTIVELTDRTCRFPLWPTDARHAERLYCGVPRASHAAGMPYCPRHAAVVWANRPF